MSKRQYRMKKNVLSRCVVRVKKPDFALWESKISKKKMCKGTNKQYGYGFTKAANAISLKSLEAFNACVNAARVELGPDKMFDQMVSVGCGVDDGSARDNGAKWEVARAKLLKQWAQLCAGNGMELFRKVPHAAAAPAAAATPADAVLERESIAATVEALEATMRSVNEVAGTKRRKFLDKVRKVMVTDDSLQALAHKCHALSEAEQVNLRQKFPLMKFMFHESDESDQEGAKKPTAAAAAGATQSPRTSPRKNKPTAGAAGATKSPRRSPRVAKRTAAAAGVGSPRVAKRTAAAESLRRSPRISKFKTPADRRVKKPTFTLCDDILEDGWLRSPPGRKISRKGLKVANISDLYDEVVTEEKWEQVAPLIAKYERIKSGSTRWKGLHAKKHAGPFTHLDIWKLCNYEFMPDHFVSRMIQRIQTEYEEDDPDEGSLVVFVPPDVLSECISRADFSLNVAACKKYKEVISKDPDIGNWEEILDNNQALFFAFNFPKDVHYCSAQLWACHYRTAKGKKVPCYKLRVFNGIQDIALKHDLRFAKSITSWASIMGVQLDKYPVIDVTGRCVIPYQQRANKNLCFIHVVLRAWILIASTYSAALTINSTVVDKMRKCALVWLLTKDKGLCHKVTNKEVVRHHLGRTTIDAKKFDFTKS